MTKRSRIVKSVDRISSLPDAVLHHILSFLPTKYAACTSVLSTRWRYLFPFTHNLDFDDSLVLNPQKNDLRSDDQTSHFMNFVDRYIMLSNVAHFNKFRLKCCENLDISRVNTWIYAALVRNVRELDLCIPNGGKPGMLPCYVFTCSTLVVLKLDIGFSLNVPASVYLPCLNSLHLHSIEFPDGISTQRLLSSCPALEDLVITRCSMKNIRVFKLSSPTLKRLTMAKNYAASRKCKLALDAPKLVYLKYAGCNRKGSSLKNLHALYEADMYFYAIDYGDSDPRFVLEMLKGINSVRSLCLSEFCGSELRSTELPLFENMTHLKLSSYIYLDGLLLLKLLHCSPNLEELIFNVTLFERCPDCGEQEDEFEDEATNNNVPSCLSYHLKVVEFMSFRDDDKAQQYDMRCVKYFMKNAGVLETVRIHMNKGRFHRKIAKKLLMMPRLSKSCKVEID